MPDVDICRVIDEADARDWWAVDDAAHRFDVVEVPADPLPEVLAKVATDGSSGECIELWVLRDDGQPVGIAEVGLPMKDNLDAAHVGVQVHPRHRRRGLGRRLFDHVVGGLRERGRSRVIGQTAEPLTDGAGAPGPSFARAVGGEAALNQIRRLLDLDELSDDTLEKLYADALPAAAGYELVQWVDRISEADVADLADLNARMAVEVPMEDLEWDPEVWDVLRLRASEEEVLAGGRRVVGTAARHVGSGRLVGYTNAGVSALQPRVGYQFDTLVEPDHRGHRLGMLMKAANLQLLRATLPAARFLNTWNAEINGPMIAINDALGFRPVDRWRDWQLRLPDRPAGTRRPAKRRRLVTGGFAP